MSKKYLCAMAGFDPDTSSRLKSLESMLCERGFMGYQTKNIPPHITLGVFGLEEEATVLEAINRAAKHEPFKVIFSHLGVFGGSRVLFAGPDPSQELLALKNAVKPEEIWSPHATILIDEPARIYEALPTAMACVPECFEEFAGMITEICLYEFQPPRHIATVKLDKNA